MTSCLDGCMQNKTLAVEHLIVYAQSSNTTHSVKYSSSNSVQSKHRPWLSAWTCLQS